LVLTGILIFFIVKKQVRDRIARVVESLRQLAKGNLNNEVTPDSKDEIGVLLENQRSLVIKLREILSSVMQSSDNLLNAGSQLSSNAEELSNGATEQASSVEEISSSMEEMSSNIQQNTENAMQTKEISQTALHGINKVAQSSQESLESIKNIAEKITIINDIAFQTNLLALNAAVEAARAGEHGKGFAVVAAEVRKLAERSKVAANEIDVLSKNSVKVTDDSSVMLESIVPEIKNTANLVQEISSASQEQASGSEQINNAIQQLNQITQQNAASSEEMATSAEELTSQAENLNETIAFFQFSGMERVAPTQKVNKKAYGKEIHHKEKNNPGKKENKKGDPKNKGIVYDLSGNDSKDSEFESY
jgi:methyl-accepting chemotaxis protein